MKQEKQVDRQKYQSFPALPMRDVEKNTNNACRLKPHSFALSTFCKFNSGYDAGEENNNIL